MMLRYRAMKCKSGTMWEEASTQLLAAIRGKMAKAVLSQRLGYIGNPVRDWEAGRRFPTMGETLRTAALRNIDVHAAFRAFHPQSAHGLSDCTDTSIAQWLTLLTGTIPISELASRTGLSRFRLRRWLKGESRPRLPDFLRLLDGITGRASDLVAELVDIKSVPALASLHKERTAAKDLAFVEPWTEAVMRLLETEAYVHLPQHDPVWISQKLGIATQLVERCTQLMLEAGAIRQEDGRLRPTESLTVYTGSNRRQVLQLKEHWSEVARTRVQQAKPQDWFSYNLMSLTHADLENVEALLKNTYSEIRSIVATSQPEQTVALVQLSLVHWNVQE